MARRLFNGRDDIRKDGVYSVKLSPWSSDAPTYVYGIYGKTDAKVGNYLTGEAVLRVAKKFDKSRYNQHYEMNASPINTRALGGDLAKEVAQSNDKKLADLYDGAMKELDTFYKHSLGREYGSEWYYENQPSGGSSGNSPI